MSKVKIRKSAFETNSSSTHSIHIDNKTMLMDTSLLPDEDGVVTLTGGEFGWEWERYNDALTKANYASIESSGISNELLIQAISEQTGARQVNINHIDWVYIDHQSQGLLGKMNLEELKNWIFNPNSWLITGNDNGSEPEDMKNFPEIDEKGVEHPFEYTHEIKIENKDIKFKFKGLPEDNSKRFFKILNLNLNLDWETEWKKDDEEYSYSFSEEDEYINCSNLKENYFIVYSHRKLLDRTNEIFNKSQHLNLIIEKINTKKHIKEDWHKRRVIKDNLLKNNFEDFTLKIKFSVKKLKK